jgi:uncharacterized protein YjbI with pentapeptide repeats
MLPMSEFGEQDLAGSRFERVNLRGATFSRVDLAGVRIRGSVFSGAQMRSFTVASTASGPSSRPCGTSASRPPPGWTG